MPSHTSQSGQRGFDVLTSNDGLNWKHQNMGFEQPEQPEQQASIL